MKRLFSLLICILISAGCVDKVRLRYNPALEERRLAPINLNTDIKVGPIVLKGYITEASSREDYYPDDLFIIGHYFTSLKEDLEEAIKKDLRYDLFPLKGDTAEILVNVKARFNSNYEPYRYKNIVEPAAVTACGLGCFLLTLPYDYPDPISADISRTCAAGSGAMIGACTWGCINHTFDKASGNTWISCDILDKNKRLIAAYETKTEGEEYFSFIRSKGNPTARQILHTTLDKALSDIKSQIDRDREKILEAAQY